MLKVRIYSKGVHVGNADLEATDPPMGCAGGRFAPLAPYAAIQPAVRQLWEAIKRNHSEDLHESRARFDALDWTLVAEDGAVLECNGGIDLYDFEELGEGTIELHIFGLSKPDGAYLRYFSSDPHYCKYYKLP